MLKNKIENKDVGNWLYERYGFHSVLLNKEVHCGFFRSKSKAAFTRTLYMFHGGSGDDSEVFQAGLLPQIANSLDQGSHENTQIVFPYIGKSFLHAHPNHPNRSFSDYFLKEIIPTCENQLLIKPQDRLLSGWSMGGQAALNMFLRYSEHFGGVGAHFPTLIGFDYKDPNQQEDYVRRQKISREMLQILLSEFQNEFLDLKDFSHHDPLHLAKTKALHFGGEKKIYFDVGQKDEFGLTEGVRALHEILLEKNVAHQYELVPDGKHDGPFIYAQIPKLLKSLL